MLKTTIDRGKEIYAKGGVRLETNILFFHFLVKQREGQEANVYFRFDTKEVKFLWQCEALSTDKRWTCAMTNADKTLPYCSHSYAAAILLTQMTKEKREREELKCQIVKD